MADYSKLRLPTSSTSTTSKSDTPSPTSKDSTLDSTSTTSSIDESTTNKSDVSTSNEASSTVAPKLKLRLGGVKPVTPSGGVSTSKVIDELASTTEESDSKSASPTSESVGEGSGNVKVGGAFNLLKNSPREAAGESGGVTVASESVLKVKPASNSDSGVEGSGKAAGESGESESLASASTSKSTAPKLNLRRASGGVKPENAFKVESDVEASESAKLASIAKNAFKSENAKTASATSKSDVLESHDSEDSVTSATLASTSKSEGNSVTEKSDALAGFSGVEEGVELDASEVARVEEEERVARLLLLGEEAVNPLLDEAYGADEIEDELVDAASVSSSLARGSVFKDFSEDASEDESFEGFEDQLSSLLADDEDELFEVTTSTSGKNAIPTSTSKGSTSSVTEKSEGKLASDVKLVEWDTVSVPKAPIAKSHSELEVQASERAEKLLVKEASESLGKQVETDFTGNPVLLVEVDERGRENGKRVVRGKRTSAAPIVGKLKPRELEFFKNLPNIKGQFGEGLYSTPVVTAPLVKTEEASERRANFEKLERVLDERNVFRNQKARGGGVRPFKLNQKTVDTLTFLALFRYATHSHISRMFGESLRTTRDRLNQLRQAGLVASKVIFSQHPIWFLTAEGVALSGFDVRHVTESRLTPSMFPHQFTVNHVAANLLGGKLNVLNLDDFPNYGRTSVKGDLILGEELTSELEILSSFSKIKLFEKGSTFRPKLLSMRDNEFRRWSEVEDKSLVPTPELVFGNEWMFTLFPSLAVGTAYHVPDLVVKRARGLNGEPRSIAVEVELSNKPLASYEKTLKAYAEDKLIYSEVVWVCKSVGPAKKLEKLGRDLGIFPGKLKIVPIWTTDGVFKGKDLWMI